MKVPTCMRFLLAITFAVVLPVSGTERPGNFAAARTPRNVSIGQFDRIISLLLDGKGWKTTLVFTSLDTNTVHADLFFVGNDGTLMEVSIAGIGPAKEIYGSLPPNQSITLETEGTGDVAREGYVSFFTLDRPADQSGAKVIHGRIGGMAIIRGTPSDRPSFETTIPFSSVYETGFALPFDNKSGLSTAAVVLNGSTRPSPLKLTIRDEMGKILVQDSSATLAPSSKISFLLTEVFPETAEQRGVIQLSTSSIALSGLALRIDPTGAFTALHSLSADVDLDAPATPAAPPPTLPGVSASCSALEGALVYANDDQFLGRITSNAFASDSMGNPYGRYGSEISGTSIFNSYGKYGGEYSPLSPFNRTTSTPPVIFLGGKAVAYLTVNPARTPRVDPLAIYPCIGRR